MKSLYKEFSFSLLLHIKKAPTNQVVTAMLAPFAQFLHVHTLILHQSVHVAFLGPSGKNAFKKGKEELLLPTHTIIMQILLSLLSIHEKEGVTALAPPPLFTRYRRPRRRRWSPSGRRPS